MFLDPYDLRRALRDGTSIVAGGVVQLSAGTTSSARSDFTFSNSPTVTFGLNGVGVITASVAPAGGGLTNIKVSAGTLSALRSDLTFNNSNGVSFGLDGAGVITATVATNYAGTGFTTATTAGTDLVGTQGTNGLSLGVPKWLTAGGGGLSAIGLSGGTVATNVTGILFTNGDGVTWNLNSNTIGASVATNYAGTGFTTATTAGTNIVGTLSNNGLSMGIPAFLTTAAGSTVTAAGGATLSFWENSPIPASPIAVPANSDYRAISVFPVILPQAVSADFIRFLATINNGQTASILQATSANTSFSGGNSITFAVEFLTQMTGASSASLGYYTSAQATWAGNTTVSNGATGSQFTISFNVSYPISNASSTTQLTKAYSQASYMVSTSQLTLFANATNLLWLDVPFNNSMSAGNYWLGVGISTASATQAGGVSAVFNGKIGQVSMMGSNNFTGFPTLMGIGSNSTFQIAPGLGSWSTTPAAITTSSMDLSEISAVNNNQRNIFQMIRRA